MPQQQAYAAPTQTPSKKSKRGLIIGIIVAAVLVVIALVVLLFVLPNLNNQSNASKGSAPVVVTSSRSASSSTASVVAGAPVFTSVTVSSQLPADNDTPDYGAINLTDGNPETAWNEGASGDGTGEYVTFSASTPQRVTSVSIMGGFPKLYKDGSDIYPKNNRPQRITISYDGGSQSFTMQDLRNQFQTFTLTKPVETKTLTIAIDSVYKGTRFDECCIAEITIQ